MRIKVMFLSVLLVSFQSPGFGAWTMNNVSDVTPGGTIACSGDALVSSSYTVTISYKEGTTVTDLTSHQGSTHYMQSTWGEEFDPDVDCNPPATWPTTGGNPNKIMQVKLVSGSTSILKYFECNTAP